MSYLGGYLFHFPNEVCLMTTFKSWDLLEGLTRPIHHDLLEGLKVTVLAKVHACRWTGGTARGVPSMEERAKTSRALPQGVTWEVVFSSSRDLQQSIRNIFTQGSPPRSLSLRLSPGAMTQVPHWQMTTVQLGRFPTLQLWGMIIHIDSPCNIQHVSCDFLADYC